MKVIIVGCGKLGSGLAKAMLRKGNEVTVIDSDAASFDLLGRGFQGKTILGNGFDREILEQAEIRRADAIIACSKSDEANALIGKLARDIYRVPRVIARLYDPRRAEIYHSLGIQTISTTTWGIQRAMEMFSYDRLDSVLSIGDSQVEIIRAETPSLLVGRTVNELTVFGEIQVVAISRDNKVFLPTLGTPLGKHDVLFIALRASSANRLKTLLGLN
jgi:trk system potassium uptake protein TrkA